MRALEIYRRTGDRLGEVHTHANLGIIDERQGRYPTALDHLRQALVLCRATGYQPGEAYTLLNLGYVLRRLARYPAAGEHFGTH